MNRKTIVFDFDGVIHKYSKGWQDGSIYDDEVPGINDVISALREDGYEIIVVSTRCRTEKGLQQVKDWLDERYIFVDYVMAEKPPATCYVDDRAICFDGDCDKLYKNIINFKTWQESEESIESINTQIQESIDNIKNLFNEAYKYLKISKKEN